VPNIVSAVANHLMQTLQYSQNSSAIALTASTNLCNQFRAMSMAVDHALTNQDRADGYILACQAKIQGNVEVDA
jgi:hypothetical protein